jgi:hypothetical protein
MYDYDPAIARSRGLISMTQDNPKLSVCLNCLSLITYWEANEYDGVCEQCAIKLQGIVDGTGTPTKD